MKTTGPIVSKLLMIAAVVFVAPITGRTQCTNADGFVLPVGEDNSQDRWGVPSNGFGHYLAGLGGYHPGSDINRLNGDDLGKPVYAAANGVVEKVSSLGRLGFLVAVRHSGQFTIQQKFISSQGQTGSYATQSVDGVYTVYIHIDGGIDPKTKKRLPPLVGKGDCVQKGTTVLGYIMNPGGGPHLHFEVRLLTMKPSNNWSLVGDSKYWARDKDGYTGYYLNLQSMIDAGMRDAMDFVNDNGSSFGTNPDGHFDEINCSEIRGWAMDRNHTANKVTVELRVDGTMVASTIADKARPDLDNAGIGSHAFTFVTPESLKDGVSHNVSLRIAGEALDLKDSPRLYRDNCTATPIASFTMTACGKSVSNTSALSCAVAPGGSISADFDSSNSQPGAGTTINEWQWRVDGVTVGTLPRLTRSLLAGTHNITLDIKNAVGNQHSTTGTVVVTQTSAPAPSIDFISPTFVAPGIFDLTINGSNFDNGAIDQIFFGNNFVGNGTVTSRNGTQIVVRESMTTAALGTYTVKVKNFDGQLSNGKPLTLTQNQTPAPILNSISPPQVSPGVFDLTLNGDKFDSGAIDQVYFNGNFVGNGTVISRNAPNQVVVRESMSTATPGNYTVKVKNSDGQLSNPAALVLTQPSSNGPTAHFSMSGQGQFKTDGQTLSLSVPVNGNVTVNFSSTSNQGSAAITSYVWKSNGTQICSNSSACSFNFGTASNAITLTITDSNGLTSTATGQVNLTFQSGPTAHFSMSAQGQTANDGGTLNLSVPLNGNVTVNFNSTSSQGSAAITSYVWKSNGTQICSNSSSCSFNFGTASNTVTLTVSDSDGFTSTATGQVNLSFQSGPTAHFSMSGQGQTANDGGTLNLSVPVNGSVAVNFSSTSSQGSAAITSYVWKSNGTQICSNSSACSFNFGTASNTITLTITDSNGLTSTATGQVNLSFQSGPTARFSMSAQGQTKTDGQTLSLSVPVNGSVTVSFNSTSSQGSAAITSYVWKSNGTQICSNSSSCSFNFGTASNTITLTVTDSNGLTSTATGQVNLTFQSGPAAHFSMSAQGQTGNDGGTLNLSVPVNGNVTVNFSSTSNHGSAAITSYIWKSNGTQICSNSSTCSFNFGTASNTITLTVTDSNGLNSTATGQVNLSFQSGPTAHFSMSGQGQTRTDGQTLSLSVPVNGNVTVSFSSTSSQGSAAITNYVWKSNGTQICSNSSTCSFNFGTASNTITLTVTDSNGLGSTATGQVNLTFH